MQSFNQVVQRGLRSPVALLVAILFGGITYAAARRTGTRRKPYYVKVRIDSRRVLEQVNPPGTTVFGTRLGSVVTVPIKSLQHHIFAFRRHTRIGRAHRGRNKKNGKQTKNNFFHGFFV